jgi:hypothetical protein
MVWRRDKSPATTRNVSTVLRYPANSLGAMGCHGSVLAVLSYF